MRPNQHMQRCQQKADYQRQNINLKYHPPQMSEIDSRLTEERLINGKFTLEQTTETRHPDNEIYEAYTGEKPDDNAFIIQIENIS